MNLPIFCWICRNSLLFIVACTSALIIQWFLYFESSVLLQFRAQNKFKTYEDWMFRSLWSPLSNKLS